MQLGDFPIKREGSQGQNKTYLIALKLAQFDFLKKKADELGYNITFKVVNCANYGVPQTQKILLHWSKERTTRIRIP